MSVVAVAHHRLVLPDSAYKLWLRDELADLLHLPHDGTRVEIIGGEIEVSPGPDYAHNKIVRDIERRLLAAELSEPSFPWRGIQTMDVDLRDIRDGYIPDLIVLDSEIDHEANAAQIAHVVPEQVALVVEVTSRSNASDDRKPTTNRPVVTKWTGDAQVGILYLLVDRDPRAARSRLYSKPDRISGEYTHDVTWEFGQTIQLPKPFDFEIPTDDWEP